ncbi:hypothetical protein CkaCkLH20_09024 [Colletotrichum karsti]|uniref:Uncharacterized protein n=1 Tax=Colletotrichum karsti TaxID=1095194 RepID=A0A9P6I7R2_9PEZI|nr:uncharacterized protein CkaCkLH20_09024 [Colletotrichum karsti]KAF9873565.1 hypothetical protein CkaCkLH20_09024 [Colletotrichum karsti]
MEVVGGAAAVAQLIGLCAKCIQTTTQVIESYQDAPIQIHQLATKIDWLQFCIGQIRDLGEGLPDEDFDKLLPAPHRLMLLVLLQRHYDQLLNIEGVGSGTKGSGKRPKLRWALLDKRKTAGIMQGLEEIQQMLMLTLTIMNSRLTTLSHTFVGLLSLSHSALVPAFETRSQEIMNSLKSFHDKQEYNPWSEFWWKLSGYMPMTYLFDKDRLNDWDFEAMVTAIEHFALHGAGVSASLSPPLHSEISLNCKWHKQIGLKCEDIARSWSYFPSDEPIHGDACTLPTYDDFIERDDRRLPRVPICVSKDGWIKKTSHTPRTYDEVALSTSTNWVCCDNRLQLAIDDEPGQKRNNEDGNEISHEEDDETVDKAEGNRRPGSFASLISTQEGRRHLLRFPLVKALCCALQRVGYRVDMDDEGDLWYDDDDGDPYFDAVEDLRDLDHEPGPLGGTCRICRNPREYGLGHILDKIENDLVEWRHERQKFVERGVLQEDDYVWPSWTRRGGYQGT